MRTFRSLSLPRHWPWLFTAGVFLIGVLLFTEQRVRMIEGWLMEGTDWPSHDSAHQLERWDVQGAWAGAGGSGHGRGQRESFDHGRRW
jgi:hypothetical protein